MIKMKKKWIRGGTALALSAVMSLSMATPVWATPSLGDGVTVTENDGITGSEIGTENTIDGATSVTVSAPVPASYEISIPKAINLSGTGLNKNQGTDFFYTIKNCNIGSGQKISITTPNTLVLKSNNGAAGASGSHTLDVYTMKDGSVQGKVDIVNAININDTEGSSENTISSDVTGTGYVKPRANIKAGRWAGVLVFTVTLSEET